MCHGLRPPLTGLAEGWLIPLPGAEAAGLYPGAPYGVLNLSRLLTYCNKRLARSKDASQTSTRLGLSAGGSPKAARGLPEDSIHPFPLSQSLARRSGPFSGRDRVVLQLSAGQDRTFEHPGWRRTDAPPRGVSGLPAQGLQAFRGQGAVDIPRIRGRIPAYKGRHKGRPHNPVAPADA